MEIKFNSSQKILDFLTLLKVEQAKENSDIFDATIWQDSNQLAEALDAVNTSDRIALTILRWCSNYPKINEALNQINWTTVRCDMDEGEIPPPSPINEANAVDNKYEIQRIIKSKQPTPPPSNPQP